MDKETYKYKRMNKRISESMIDRINENMIEGINKINELVN